MQLRTVNYPGTETQWKSVTLGPSAFTEGVQFVFSRRISGPIQSDEHANAN